jgi:hypothetical protein
MRILAIVGVLALAGCAGQGGTWVKPGADEATFASDKYACLVDSKNGVGGYDGQLFNACMDAKGYSFSS